MNRGNLILLPKCCRKGTCVPLSICHLPHPTSLFPFLSLITHMHTYTHIYMQLIYIFFHTRPSNILKAISALYPPSPVDLLNTCLPTDRNCPNCHHGNGMLCLPSWGRAVHSPISLSPFPVWVRTPGVGVLTNTQGIPKVGGPRMLTHSCCIQINCKCTQASQGLIPRCSSEPQRHCKRQQVPFGSGCWRPEWPARTSQVPTACSHTLLSGSSY